ncbi:MAG TPA: glycosyltransferase [Sphingopyxis sp.]|nr:glycosyltransferase [Sphingopyxis sp.]HMP46502.1 glycosyltransferase [Sphingopyxis sp.]HMQ17888.1 glycosyltransferase [Sphingopyxis sp.]
MNLAALVTVSSPDFRIGTEVMLASFLETNPWFAGEIVVLHSRLADADRAVLAGAFPRLSCRPASPRLAAAIDALAAAHPHLASRRDRFLSLETLLLPPGGRYLFADSDLLFLGDIAPLLATKAPLVAAPDAAMLRGNVRDADTLAEVAATVGAPPSFNAGLLVYDPAAAPDSAAALWPLLDPESWGRIASSHTDQAVWNLLLRGHVDLVSTRFNLMLTHRAASFAHEPVPLGEARVLHFNGPAKPWRPDRHAEAIARDPQYAEALRLWTAARRRWLGARR